MKKTLITFMFTFLCCVFLFLLLFNSKECIVLASNGLLIWYKNMIPTLFPFMVLSGFLVRTKISYALGAFLRPILGILLPLPTHMLYVVFMGFLCGFPMGAKIVSDMIEKKQISTKEGQYLLSFCNNIGPLYMMGYVIPLFQYENKWLILGLMYSVPLIFGVILKFIYFPNSNAKSLKIVAQSNPNSLPMQNTYNSKSNYPACFQDSLTSAIEQITVLGGCMVFFNTLQIIPMKLISHIPSLPSFCQSSYVQGILCSLVEIGGGLQQLVSITPYETALQISPYLILSLLTFGGLSCTIQTFFIIKNTELNLYTYLKHKTTQSCIYILLFFLLN